MTDVTIGPVCDGGGERRLQRFSASRPQTEKALPSGPPRHVHRADSREDIGPQRPAAAARWRATT